MINDLKQPAKDWLADAMDNFAKALRDGNDPALGIEFKGVKFELRLMHLPGHFERHRNDLNTKK